MEQQSTTNKTAIEIMRLLKISREASEETLLDEALADRSKDVSTVCRLYKFVRDSFGPGTAAQSGTASKVTEAFWNVVSRFLEDAGLDKDEIEKIRDPYKKAGCVLDEFKELGYEFQ
jgi:hypothetical protein